MRNGGKLEDDLDALFMLPLTEFTGARNALAARLKKAGQGDRGNQVKALVKPSLSAWAANQLYWRHRKAFDQLITTGQRFRKAQTAGKVADIHAALDARREALLQLANLAMALLRDAGHNPSPDIERRITTTLEALSVHGSLPDGPPLGRLTQDIDPPGFDSLASLMSGAGISKLTLVPGRLSQSRGAANNSRPVTALPDKPDKTAAEARRLAGQRKAMIAAAKVSLQDASRLLNQARARQKRAQSAQDNAKAEAKAAEQQRRAAEQRFEKAKSASEFANRRAAHAANEAEEAAQALADATRAVEEATRELEALS